VERQTETHILIKWHWQATSKYIICILMLPVSVTILHMKWL